MSIIQEALNKVKEVRIPIVEKSEDTSTRQDAVSKASEMQPAPDTAQPMQRKTQPNTLTLTIVLLIATALFAKTYLGGSKTTGKKEKATVEDKRAHQEVLYRPVNTADTEEKPASVTEKTTAYSIVAPYKPVPLETKHYPDFVLNGIMYVAGAPRAIINDAVVGPGDFVGGAKVLNITKDSVKLLYDNVEVVLRLKK